MITAETMLRIGIVSSVDADKLKARVYFPDAGNMVSDWLYLIQQPRKTKKDGEHDHTDSMGGTTSKTKHTHELEPWVPEINDKVLVLYPCGIDKDGFIQGVIP